MYTTLPALIQLCKLIHNVVELKWHSFSRSISIKESHNDGKINNIYYRIPHLQFDNV